MIEPKPEPQQAAGAARARLRAQLAQRPPRDKADTALLLCAALMVLAPHFAHLPLWTSVCVCAALLWRALLTLRGKRLPPLWLLLPVSLLAMAGVYQTYHTLLGRDAGVAMLALLLSFKLLEMHARRDLFVVVFLSFFVLLTTFFYSQTMLTALTMAATLLVLLTAQLSFQYAGALPPLRERLRLAAHIALLAAPLALLLFVGFPRIQGPLWGAPGDGHGGRSGLSDSMAPGSVSQLAQSDDPAFRVRFLDPPPPQSQLYWRGIVLGDYDGRTWTRVARRRGQLRRDLSIHAAGTAIRHQVTMEASGQRWLFMLELSHPDPELADHRVLGSDELEVFAATPITQRLRYQTSAWTDFTIEADVAPEQLRRWLELPIEFNLRTLLLAGRLRQARPADSVQAVLRMFRDEQFSYTLQPPLLGRDAVDDFLFTSKAGFCEHYAGAFVVLMRAMQIPARVVTGYQGGAFNPLDGVLTVRQSDAHAWAEVWLAGQGWRRVDPTAAIAPERIRRNLAAALPQRDAPFGLGALMDLRNDPHAWLAQLGFAWSAMNNSWNQWVLDYNPERQRGFLEELGGAFGNRRSALGLGGAAGLLALLLWRRRRPAPAPLDALYAAFCRQQARHGVARRLDEGPLDYAARLRAMDASAAKHAAMERFLNAYGALKYGDAGHDTHSASLTTLKTLLPLCQ